MLSLVNSGIIGACEGNLMILQVNAQVNRQKVTCFTCEANKKLLKRKVWVIPRLG